MSHKRAKSGSRDKMRKTPNKLRLSTNSRSSDSDSNFNQNDS